MVETRLILLDGALILFMSLSLLSYIKFHQLRYRPFSTAWWAWLSATGFFLACTLGCKMVGLLTFCTIGTAVVWDLWGLLDIRRSHPLSMVRSFAFDQFQSSLTPTSFLCTGAVLETFPGQSDLPDRRPVLHLPLVLLDPFQDPLLLGHGR